LFAEPITREEFVSSAFPKAECGTPSRFFGKSRYCDERATGVQKNGDTRITILHLHQLFVKVAGVNLGWSASGSDTLGAVFWIARSIGLCCGVYIAFEDCARRLCTRLSQRAD
jgi:hypothetical protein